MAGFATQTPARPSPLELIVRLAAASALVLWGLQLIDRPLVQSLLPVFSGAVSALDDEFTIFAADIAQEGPSQAIRFRANLTRPVEIGGRTFVPFGWGQMPAGGFQVTIAVGGVLQYCALAVILALAWPVQRGWEYPWRIVIALPLLTLLLLIDIPLTVLAELWNLLREQLDPGAVHPLMIFSRFLAGGGGLALGILFGALTIALASRISPRGG